MKKIKLIIAGSRNFTNYAKAKAYLDAMIRVYEVTEVISGGARGADSLGEKWAWEKDIPLVVVRADWQRFGKRAGMVRNQLMALQADAVIVFWDGNSRGSSNMIDIAKEKELLLKVIRI